MGSINYGSSKFITLGIKPYDFEDTKKYILENLCDFEYFDGDPENVTDEEVYNEINVNYEADYENAACILKKYDFECLEVSIEPGYYEGLYIDIRFTWLYFDDIQGKRSAQKELTKYAIGDTLAISNGNSTCNILRVLICESEAARMGAGGTQFDRSAAVLPAVFAM